MPIRDGNAPSGHVQRGHGAAPRAGEVQGGGRDCAVPVHAGGGGAEVGGTIMRTVWKHSLKPGLNEIIVPPHSYAMAFQDQRGSPQIWILVPMDNPNRVVRMFRVVKTGEPIPDSCVGRYVSTVQMGGGGLGFHVFEEVEDDAAGGR